MEKTEKFRMRMYFEGNKYIRRAHEGRELASVRR